MKKFISILVTIFCLFSMSSCRQDASFDDHSNFDFSLDFEVLSDGNGEVNSPTELSFNLNPSYDFQKISTTFKIASSKNADIILNGNPLIFNKTYSFENLTNELVYVGKVEGDHRIKVTITNSFGIRKEYNLTLNYND